MSKPELSIVMLAYNSQEYIVTAIDSLLNQSHTNFELIIIDDGSSDSTADIIASYTDTRIRRVHNAENKGIVLCKNMAFDLVASEYVSFFDSDDLAHPLKNEKQLDFLRANKSYGLVGSSVILINDKGRETERWKIDAPSEYIVPHMIFHNYFVNSSVVFRRDLVADFRLPVDIEVGEDYLLWWYLLKRSKAVNIPEYLTYYRQHEKSVMYQNAGKRWQSEKAVYNKILGDIGIVASDEELRLHIALKDSSRDITPGEQRKYRKWLSRIADHTLQSPMVSRRATLFVIIKRWLKVCYRSQNPFLFLKGLFGVSGFLFFSLKGNPDTNVNTHTSKG